MARSNLQIKVGTYTGNGVDSTNITDVGFRPHAVIVKGGTTTNGYLKTRNMVGDTTCALGTSNANANNIIQEILNTGFQIGNNANLNTNGTTYYYFAIRGAVGQQYFRTSQYIGDGNDNRNITTLGFTFTPDILLIKGDVLQHSAFRIVDMTGDNTTTTSNTTGGSNVIQSFLSGGFQSGTNQRVNQSAINYYAMALKKLPGVINCGRYTGDATDERKITGVGFQPDIVLIKNESTSDTAILRTSSMIGDISAPLGAAAPAADLIQSLDSDGFTVGTTTAVNGNGNTMSWIALRAGDFNAPIIRSTA